jgi:peroxiredoxin (alkyl hydroperoxide reductase subunit C)
MTAQRLPELGEMAPEFKLKGPDGEFVTLSEYRGRNAVVLVFYPLAFSRVCSNQLPMIERDLGRIRSLGGEVLGISVDSHHANREFGKRLGLSYPLLSDFQKQASAAYGVLEAEAGVSDRALFVIDRDGRLAYRDVSPNPDDIPSNETLIVALERLSSP